MPPEKLELCGLDPASVHRADRLQDNTNPQLVNLLKVKKYSTQELSLLITPVFSHCLYFVSYLGWYCLLEQSCNNAILTF